jgi:hypothetical protein
MGQIVRDSRIALVVISALALSSCHDDSGGRAQPATLTIDNAPDVIRDVLNVGLGSTVMVLPGAAGLALALFVVQPGEAVEVDCQSGTARLRTFGNEISLAGLKADYNQCAVFAGSDAVLDGLSRLDVSNFIFDTSVDRVELDGDLQLSDLTVLRNGNLLHSSGNATIDFEGIEDGPSNLTLSGEVLRVDDTVTDWKLRDFVITEVFEESGEDILRSFSGSGTLEIPGLGAVAYQVQQAITSINADNPNAGVLLITGANGASLEVTVVPQAPPNGGVGVSYDLDGDGEADGVPVLLTWDAVGGGPY